MDWLYGVGTGWLGWPPAVVWDTPIPELMVALDARAEWVKMTNPFGGGKKKEAEKPKPKTLPMAAFIDSVARLPGTKIHGRK